MMERLLSARNTGRRPSGSALFRLVLLGAMLCVPAVLSPALFAGQEPGTWEFNLSYVSPSMDKSPVTLDATASIDVDGTLKQGLLTQSFEIPNSQFGAFRLGYVWTLWLESELTYDNNHVTSDYTLTIEGLGKQNNEVVTGPVGTNITTYEFSVQYYPIGNKRYKWQPYIYLGAGWIDVDFDPSSSIESATSSSLVANTFSVDFPTGDHGLMLDYGIGVKYFLKDEIALRAEWRSKQYDLLGDRRLDREISFGISFFTAGDYLKQ